MRDVDIGVDRIGAADGIAWIAIHLQRGVACGGKPGGFGDDVGRWLVACRVCHANTDPDCRCGEHQGDRDVVAIAHVGDLQAVQPPEVFLQGQEVGQRLGGVELVGEPIDDRDTGIGRQLLDIAMQLHARDQHIDIPAQDLRGIGNSLTSAELQIVDPEINAVPPSWAMPASNETRVRVLGC